MGCDFFYKGNLPQPRLQEMVIEFVRSYYTDHLIIQPRPDRKYRTFFEPKELEHSLYPFDFFGIVPKSAFLFEQCQFVFDRTNGGRLVSLLKIPDSFAYPADGETEYMCRNNGIQVCVRDNGYNRLLGGSSFALLLNIIRLRYWPELSVLDDYDVFKDISKLLDVFGLTAVMKDWRFGFDECEQIFSKEYTDRYPQSPPKEPKRVLRVIPDNVEAISTEELALSMRTSGCLKKAGIETVGEVMRFTSSELMKIKGFGMKSVHELRDILEELGVYLRDDL